MSQTIHGVLIGLKKPRANDVFNVILESNGNWNISRITQAEIGRKLDMNRQNVYRAVKELVDVGLVRKVRTGFRLNPYYVWLGSSANHYLAQVNWDR